MSFCVESRLMTDCKLQHIQNTDAHIGLDAQCMSVSKLYLSLVAKRLD